jgi:DNA-directed RNA polymerase II subunit RPB2
MKAALDFIGKRSKVSVGVVKEKRIRFAMDLLQKEMLPHVGIGEYCETKKAYFFGYMIHKLLQCALGRRQEDDRYITFNRYKIQHNHAHNHTSCMYFFFFFFN